MTWRRGEIVLAVVAILAALGCARLGIWQLDRLAQRRERNAALAARLALPPIDLGTIRVGDVPAESLYQRRIVARGVFDYAHERVWPGRAFEGTPGVALVTLLRLPTGSAVFVDRGWVPSPDAFRVDQAAFREADSAAVEGIAFVPPRGRGDVDLRAPAVPYAVFPVVLQQNGPEPDAPRRLPRRWPAPALDDGPHLSYAIQWFSFAVIALVGTAALIRKSSRARELSR
jgi:surfeit locus 1 family protein